MAVEGPLAPPHTPDTPGLTGKGFEGKFQIIHFL